METESKIVHIPVNPRAVTEMPIRTEFDSDDDYQTKVRERMAMCLEAIADKIQRKTPGGNFSYWMPDRIVIRIELAATLVPYMRADCEKDEAINVGE